MLVCEELDEIQGLLKYLENLKHLRPDDITLFAANGEPAAIVGYDDGGNGIVLKRVL